MWSNNTLLSRPCFVFLRKQLFFGVSNSLFIHSSLRAPLPVRQAAQLQVIKLSTVQWHTKGDDELIAAESMVIERGKKSLTDDGT